MATLQASGIADLVVGTLRKLGRPNVVEIATNLQDFPLAKQLMKQQRVKVEDGYEIQTQIMVDHSDNAQMVGLYQADPALNASDVLKSITIPFRHILNHWVIDKHLITMNRGESRIVDLVKTARQDMMIGWTTKLEAQGWTAPTSSSDALNIWGIPLWIVKSNTDGFEGGAPSGFSNVAGLSTTDYPNWKNYNFKYTNLTDDDFFTKLRRAIRRTNFKSPMSGAAPLPSPKQGDQRGFYCTEGVAEAAYNYIRANNDDLGDDLMVKEGSAMINRRPLEWVPYLTANDSTGVIYGIHWGWMKFHILGEWWMREDVQDSFPGYHNCTGAWVDCSVNLVCKNRREQFVGHTGI